MGFTVTVSVFPAPAGINQDVDRKYSSSERVPRASGDKPMFLANILWAVACSPRQRG
ncbi:hypothetical protein IDG15_001202 [Salmonella enterica subsp. enterica serovar Enteritidis]|nr:hypothetical protein [Salmonella enterica subsp. enterica serovar Enteritidis]